MLSPFYTGQLMGLVYLDQVIIIFLYILVLAKPTRISKVPTSATALRAEEHNAANFES